MSTTDRDDAEAAGKPGSRPDPLARITAGVTGEYTETVTFELTVAHRVPGMPQVYGTPFMIYAMETAAARAVAALLPPGWVSVGVDVDIRHLAASPIGRIVTARAVVTGHDDKLIAFDIEAHDGERRIGRGRHTRAPVEIARLMRQFGG